jgi:hypothetical protein
LRHLELAWLANGEPFYGAKFSMENGHSRVEFFLVHPSRQIFTTQNFFGPEASSTMVDITNVEDESPVEDTTTSVSLLSSSSGNEKDADGWEKLMGDDLLMKVRRQNSGANRPIRTCDMTISLG